jgi:hypothetical protein
MMMKNDEGSNERPFYFVVVVWGDLFCNYFLQYCVPSLLAPGNIPALDGVRPAKFLIATTASDWKTMTETAIFRVLQRYAEPLLLELPPQPMDRPNWVQSVVGHKLCCELSFREKAYKILVVPDYIYSDGIVSRLHRLALLGAQAVLTNSQPRIAEESFFKHLDEMGLLPFANPRDTGTPLVYAARQLVSAALRAMHSMTIVNEWDAPYFCGYAATPWWRVPGEDGIVICGMCWNPILIDYAAVLDHNSSLLEDRGLDGDYDMRTIGGFKAVYAMRDSDEFYAASWSPRSVQECALRQKGWSNLRKGSAFRASYYGSTFNWLHRASLFLPLRLHSEEVNEKWEAIENKALCTLLTWVDPPLELAKFGEHLLIAAKDFAEIDSKIAEHRCRKSTYLWRVIRPILLLLPPYVFHTVRGPRSVSLQFTRLTGLVNTTRVAIRLMILALRGDNRAQRWWWWRLRKLKAVFSRRAFNEPRPPIGF